MLRKYALFAFGDIEPTKQTHTTTFVAVAPKTHVNQSRYISSLKDKKKVLKMSPTSAVTKLRLCSKPAAPPLLTYSNYGTKFNFCRHTVSFKKKSSSDQQRAIASTENVAAHMLHVPLFELIVKHLRLNMDALSVERCSLQPPQCLNLRFHPSNSQKNAGTGSQRSSLKH